MLFCVLLFPYCKPLQEENNCNLAKQPLAPTLHTPGIASPEGEHRVIRMVKVLLPCNWKRTTALISLAQPFRRTLKKKRIKRENLLFRIFYQYTLRVVIVSLYFFFSCLANTILLFVMFLFCFVFFTKAQITHAVSHRKQSRDTLTRL